MSDATKAKRAADRIGRSRVLRALVQRMETWMGRAGLIAYAVEPGGAGGTLMGGDAPAAAPAAAPASAPAAAPAAAAPAAAPAADAPAGAPAAAPAADGSDPNGQAAQAADGKDGKAGKAADGKDGKPAAGAPEKYEDFKLPEGFKADEAFMGKFTEWAKGKNLSQEAAQEAVNMAAELQQQNVTKLQEAIETQSQQWAKDTLADKEFGGDKFKENLSVALRARDQFATPELKQLLETSKLGNHPEVVRFFYRVGQSISQDGFVPGRVGSARPSNEQVLYPSSVRH